ncbi:hypothetical protein STEG23_028774, partial [Scotinomys teguina]
CSFVKFIRIITEKLDNNGRKSGWNLPSSAFCKAGFVDRLGLFMVSQTSWTFCFMTFWDLVFSLTDESVFSIARSRHYRTTRAAHARARERAGTALPNGGGSRALNHTVITRQRQPTSRGHHALLHSGITWQQRTALPYNNSAEIHSGILKVENKEKRQRD